MRTKFYTTWTNKYWKNATMLVNDIIIVIPIIILTI
jgi:hypothetical protein